jgi:hypothetical protein
MDLYQVLYYEVLPNMITLFVILYFGILVYLRYSKLSRRKAVEDLKKYTLEFCLKDEHKYLELLDTLRYSNEIESVADFFSVMDYFEKIAIGVESDVFDKDIILKYYIDYFNAFYREHRYFAVENRTEWIMKYYHLERLVQYYSEFEDNQGRVV